MEMLAEQLADQQKNGAMRMTEAIRSRGLIGLLYQGHLAGAQGIPECIVEMALFGGGTQLVLLPWIDQRHGRAGARVVI